MYSTLLALHNVNRWLVTFALMALVYLALEAQQQHQQFNKPVRISLAMYSGFYVLQAVLGLWLYIGYSPYYQQVWGHGFQWPEDYDSFFFGLFHPGLMLLGAIVVRVMESIIRRRSDDRQQLRLTWITIFITLLLVLVAMPYDRPMMRF